MKIFKPKFWDQNYFTIFSILLMPFSLIYLIIINLKKIISKSKNFPIPIICVGNIYIGGTGKTPITLKICKILKELEQDPVIVRKIYSSHDDEISLIKKYNKIILSKKRVEGIEKAINKNFKFVVMDDGFQDMTIKKDLNIICFHDNQRIGNGLLLPSGPLRERLTELKNCQIVLINGKQDIEFEQKLKKYNTKLDFFYYNSIPKNIDNFKNKKLIAFAGIGNPINFFNLLKENHLNLVKEISFPDHYNYSEQDLIKLHQLEKQYNAKLITTEKDFLRISPFTRKTYDYIKIEPKLKDEEAFKNRIKKLIK